MSDSTQLVPAGGTALSDFPNRSLPGHNALNVGAVAIEQERAIAEVQGQIIIAQRCPRSMAQSMSDFLEACKSEEFAATAFYSVPNRGSGPSIRFAEEAARCYGNFKYGHRELSRSEGKSEIEVFAWDMQKNNLSTRQITVMHILDKRGSAPKALTDQADIDNRIANVASKQMRGRILALLPKAMVAAGEAMAKKTLAGGNDKPLSAKVTDMVQAFQVRYGVNVQHLEAKIGHSLDLITIDEFADLRGVFNALNEGDKPSDHFPVPGAEPEQGADTTADRLAAKAGKPAAPKKAATEEKKADDKKPDAGAEAAKPDEAAKATEQPKPTEEVKATEQAKPDDGGPPDVPPAEDESGPATSEQVQPPQEQAQQAQSDAPAPDAPAATAEGAQASPEGAAARPALF